jgi:hypothetical protein
VQASLGALLIAAFLTVALAPCPPRPDASGAGPASRAQTAEHPEGCPMHEADDFVTAPCPCGCGEHAPAAGSSARLGVALPSTPLLPLVLPVAGHAAPAAALAEEVIAAPIDHVPLPA